VLVLGGNFMVKFQVVKNPVAAFNPRSKVIHSPDCVHIFSLSVTDLDWISSWASAEGRHARVVGHACKSCNLEIPELIGE
jgi:hypothetical protein